MQTRTYADLFSLIQALCGVVFASIETTRIKSLINRRAKKAYNASNNWPRFITVGESRTVTSKGIPYAQTGLNTIGTFLKIQAAAPYTTSSPQDYNFYVDSSGAELITSANPSNAFVTYKRVLSDIYGPGVSSGDPSGSVSDITNVPAEWFEYIAHGVYSDYLRAEGQQEKSIAADQEASLILEDELVQAEQQGAGVTFGSRYLANVAGNLTSNAVPRRSQG
jgi:hypothetical protein